MASSDSKDSVDGLLIEVFDGFGRVRGLRKQLDEALCDGWAALADANREGRVHHVEFNSRSVRDRELLRSAYRTLGAAPALELVELDAVYQEALTLVENSGAGSKSDEPAEDEPEHGGSSSATPEDSGLRNRKQPAAKPGSSAQAASPPSASSSSTSASAASPKGPRHAYDTDSRRRFKALPGLPSVEAVMAEARKLRAAQAGDALVVGNGEGKKEAGEGAKPGSAAVPSSLFVGFDERAARLQWSGPVPSPSLEAGMRLLQAAVRHSVSLANEERRVSRALDELARRGVSLGASKPAAGAGESAQKSSGGDELPEASASGD